MLILRILLQLLAVGLALVIALLDYVWHDKRRTRFKRGRVALVCLSLFFLVASLVNTVLEERARQAEASVLAGRLISLQATADSAARSASEQARGLSISLEKLQQQNDGLSQRLAPFLAVARTRYPSRPESAALTALSNDLALIDRRVRVVETRTLPRRIPPSSLATLGLLLAPFRGSVIAFEIHGSDPETSAFAGQLRAALQQAGLTISGGGFYLSPEPPSDVTVVYGPACPTPFIDALFSALRVAGVRFTSFSNSNREGTLVTIQVGAQSSGA